MEPESRDEELADPDAPAPGALPGTLHLIAGPDCRLRTLDLARLVLSGPGVPVGCRFWLSPRGDQAVFMAAPDGRQAARELRLAPLDDPLASTVLGASVGEVAWSPDGARLAWCGPNGTVAVRVDGASGSERLAGCRPRFMPSGAVVTRQDEPEATYLLADGHELLSPAQLDAPFAERGSALLEVAGFGIGPDGTVAVAALGQAAGALPLALLELWRDGELLASLRVPTFSSPAGPGLFGLRVEISPDGNEIALLFPDALAFPGPGTLVALVDVRTMTVVLEEPVVYDVAWSPDSAWLALARGDGVAIYGTERSRALYRLPLATRALAWR